MTKRFYVEQKLTQTSLKLDKLATNQEDLSTKDTDTKQQEAIKKEFEQN
ncbi:MAG: hypothetical protein HC798_04580 [Polaribacter sp.]|nr:hypothetical protein [Polaribacter sp.]